MTETEWQQASDPYPLLYHFRHRKEKRRRRLFACACCRRVWHRMTDSDSREAVETAEEFADNLVRESYRAASFEQAQRAFQKATEKTQGLAFSDRQELDRCMYAAAAAAHAVDIRDTKQAVYYARLAAFETLEHNEEENLQQARLVRDIFGNPFRPVTFDPVWRTSAAVALAAQMYETRDFSPMPILADALQDAGCDSDEVLTHCRDPHGVHVRGCWVVDLVLGKG